MAENLTYLIIRDSDVVHVRIEEDGGLRLARVRRSMLEAEAIDLDI